MPHRPQPTRKPVRTARRHNWGRRGSSTQRGYDSKWQRLRAAYIIERPLCERCEQHGRVTVASEVHHKQRFADRYDPKRLEWSNLEALCEACHRARERERKGEAGQIPDS